MKTILSLFFFCLFFILDAHSQIRISGIENVKTQTNNSGATFVRKEVQVTRTTQGDGTSNNGVVTNEIKDAKTYKTKDGVAVELDAQTSKEDSITANQIVIDLEKAKANPNGYAPKDSPGSTTNNIGPRVQLEKNQYFTVFSPEGLVLYTSKPGGAAPNAATTTTTVIEEKVDVQKTTNTWALGPHIGTAFLQGDVRARLGFGMGITLQKAFSRRFSIRYQGLFSQVYGQDWQLKNIPEFYNYKTRISDHSFQAVISLNARTPKKVLFNFMAGAGFTTIHTWKDARDLNGIVYDYSDIAAPITRGDRGEIINAINTLQDNTFETIVQRDQLKAGINNTLITPSLMAGLGMTIKLTRRTDLNIEHRISWHNADGMDNYVTGGSDILHYSSVGLNFKLGKKEMAAWWDPKKKVQITTYDFGTISKSETGKPQIAPIDLSKTKAEEKPYIEENIIGFVFFDVNASKVKQEYYAELYKLDKFLDENPDIKIAIVGHLDSKGSEFGNTTIAKDRAQSVYHFLTGIFKMDPDRFETYYEGENNYTVPVGNTIFARNASEKNKSVTIIIK